MITYEEARDTWDYDPDTGVLRWKNSKQAGSSCGNGYIYVGYKNKKYLAHRLIWLLNYEEWPIQIDHTNRIKTDNRLCNLRNVVPQDNCRNTPIRITNTSKVVGVYWDKINNKWMSYINDNHKKINLGRFNNLFDAVCARKSAEIQYNFHPNHGR